MSRVFKQQELNIDISARSRTPIRADSTFFSRDVRSGKKIINFLLEGRPLDISDAEIVMDFHFISARARVKLSSEDGSIVIENAIRGQCSLIIPSYVYAHHGTVKIYVYVKYPITGQEFDAGVIKTRFEKSSLDKNVEKLQKFYIKRVEDVIAEVLSKVEGLDIDNLMESFRAEMEAKIQELADGDLIDVKQIQARLSEDLQEWLEGKLDNDILAEFKADIEGKLKELEIKIAGLDHSFFFVISDQEPVVEDGNHPLWLKPIAK